MAGKKCPGENFISASNLWAVFSLGVEAGNGHRERYPENFCDAQVTCLAGISGGDGGERVLSARSKLRSASSALVEDVLPSQASRRRAPFNKHVVIQKAPLPHAGAGSYKTGT